MVHAQPPFRLLDPHLTRPSGETAFGVERLFLLQDVVTRPRQFVRKRFGGNYAIGLGFLLLEKSFGLLTESPGKIGGFDERPDQVSVACLVLK